MRQVPPPSGWRGSPCPTCAGPLSERGPALLADEFYAIILGCPSGHFWEERICARTLYSSVLVHRRADLERRPGRPRRPADADARA